MRRVNAILTVLILIFFVAHGVLGSFQLIGIGDTASKFAARMAEVLIYIHMAIGIKYSYDTFKAQRKSGAAYFKENKIFWVRRISGLAIFLFMIPHFGSFSMTVSEDVAGTALDGEYVRLAVFDGFRLALNIMLVISIAVHVISNIRPSLISFGIKSIKDVSVDILWVLAILLVLMGIAFIVYYLRWNYW